MNAGQLKIGESIENGNFIDKIIDKLSFEITRRGNIYSRLEDCGTVNIDKLNNITEKLIDFSELITIKDNYLYMKSEDGGQFEFIAVWKERGVSMIKSGGYIKKNVSFGKHVHREREIIGIYDGRMSIEMDSKINIINKYETITIPPFRSHRIKFIEDSLVWVITMPDSESFPNTP